MSNRSKITDFYIQHHDKCGRLAEEIAFILKGRLDSERIPFASVTWRAKTLESLLAKIERKGYADPVKQVTDMAGVRLVYLYPSDYPAIEKLIKEEFDILGESAKPSPENIDEFGYAAHHYNVIITSRYYGPRYEPLRNLLCEIQVRTVLQDAWAVVAHHLEYKNESSVPTPLRRQLHALAGSFEVADNHLDQLRKHREEYVASLAHLPSTSSKAVELNYDSFLNYIGLKHPDLKLETTRGAAQGVHESLQHAGISTVDRLNRLYEQTEAARREFFERETIGQSQARHAFVALGLTNKAALRWFAQDEDVRLIEELRKKYGTLG